MVGGRIEVLGTETRKRIAALLVEAKRLAILIGEKDLAYFISMAGVCVVEAQDRAIMEHLESSPRDATVDENVVRMLAD